MACTACGSILNGIYKHAPMTREQVDDSRNRDREIVIITDPDLFGSSTKAPSSMKKLLAALHSDTVLEPMRFTPAFEMTSDANDSDRRHLVTWEMMYAMRNNFGGLRYLKDGGINVDGDEVKVTETVGSLRSFNGSEDGVKGGLNTGCITEVGEEGKFSVSLGQNSRVTGDFSTIAGGGADGATDGATGNYISAAGSFIGSGDKNSIESSFSYGFIGAGYGNKIYGESGYGAIVSGSSSYIDNSNYGFIGSGMNNYINNHSHRSVVVGGNNNYITLAPDAFIGSGSGNYIIGDSAYSAILAGYSNHIVSATASSILAGYSNAISAPDGTTDEITGSAIIGYNNVIHSSYASILGGSSNNITSANYGFIGAGDGNQLGDSTRSAPYAFIGAGTKNTIYSGSAFIGSGSSNVVEGDQSFIGAGSANKIAGARSFIGGGFGNEINPTDYSVIVGGNVNKITATQSTSFIGGGTGNLIDGTTGYGVIVGGETNLLHNANYSIVGGGQSNKIYVANSFIGAGSENTIDSTFSSGFIGAGWKNRIYGESAYGAIVSGRTSYINNSNDGFIGAGVSIYITNANQSVIVGGSRNYITSASHAFIGGGMENKIVGDAADAAAAGYNAILAGNNNTIESVNFINSSSILAGDHNTIENKVVGIGVTGSAIVGFSNTIGSTSAFISGSRNAISSFAPNTSILGGWNNKINGTESGSAGCGIICGGSGNKLIAAIGAFIGSGDTNESRGNNSFIGAGVLNYICSNGGNSNENNSAIVAGRSNAINGTSGYNYGFIGAGKGNVIDGNGLNDENGGVAGMAVIVGGYSNKVTDSFGAFIGSGQDNIIKRSSSSAIISGMSNEIYIGDTSVLVGGKDHYITGSYSAVVGGSNNYIYGWHSIIGGGLSNHIGEVDRSLSYIVIGGGDRNSITGYYSTASSIVGGQTNEIVGSKCAGMISGESCIVTKANYSVIAGGYSNTIGISSESHEGSAILAGKSNCITASCAIIGGGELNELVASKYAIIGGGYRNEINASVDSGIFSGQANKILEEATHSFIGSGYGNEISNGGVYSAIVGGYQNYIADAVDYVSNGYPAKKCGSFIGGGEMNRIESTQYCNSIVGGGRNKISESTYLSVISGGDYNTISSGSVNSFIGAGHYVNIVSCNSASASGVCAAYITNSSFSTVSGTAMTVVDAYYGNITGSRNFLITSRQSVISGVRNGISGSSESGILSGRYNMLGYMFYDGESKSMAVPDFGKPIDTRVLPSFNLNINRQLETETNAWRSYGGSSTIVGGAYNILASAFRSVISGGEKNLIDYAMNSCTIGGGYNNRIINFSTRNDTLYMMDNGSRDVAAVISGGKDNTIYYGDAYYQRPYTDIGNAITGGIGNTIGKEFYPTGRNQNNNEAGGVRASTIVGGENNMIGITNQSFYVTSPLQYISIVGGKNNTITGFSKYSSIVGGVDNTLSSNGSMIGCMDTTSTTTPGSIVIGLGTISKELHPFGPSISVESGTHKNESLNSAVFIENLSVYGRTDLHGLNVYGAGTDTNGRFKSYTPIFMSGKPIPGGYTYSSGESPNPDESNTAVIDTNGTINCSRLYVNRSIQATETSSAGYIECYKLKGGIVEGDGQDAGVQNFKYIFSTGYVHAKTTIASSGSVLGKTITSTPQHDFKFNATPYYAATYNGIKYESTTPGNISSGKDMLAIGNVISGEKFIGDGVEVEGSVYANNVLLTSDRRSKYDIAPLGYGLEFINSLSPVSYKYTVGGTEKNEEIVTEDVIDDNGEVTTKISCIKKATERKGIRTHFGLIAQDVKAVVDQYGVDFAGHSMDNKDDPESKQRLAYTEFIAPLIKSVQELSKQVTDLKAEINELKK